jgi:hypothetical protein
MAKTTVFGILLNQRNDMAPRFQEIVTRYGCNIKTRIGLHNVSENVCSASGIILLETIGKDLDIANLENDLRNLEGAEIQKMVFSAPGL